MGKKEKPPVRMTSEEKGALRQIAKYDHRIVDENTVVRLDKTTRNADGSVVRNYLVADGDKVKYKACRGRRQGEVQSEDRREARQAEAHDNGDRQSRGETAEDQKGSKKMKDLDIMELCTLQALLIRYRHELIVHEQDNVAFGDDELLTKEIGAMTAALDVVVDDITYRASN